MKKETCTIANVVMATGICIVLLLSVCEVLAPITVAIVSGIILSEEYRNPILESYGSLVVSTIGLVISSVGLCITFLVQWWRPFKTIVCCTRHVFNISFTVFAIWHLVNMRESSQISLIESLTENWNDNKSAVSFEEKYSCSGYLSCQKDFILSVDRVYKYGRNLKAAFGIFWAAIIFFGLISTGAVVVSYIQDKL